MSLNFHIKFFLIINFLILSILLTINQLTKFNNSDIRIDKKE
jgi:hypothetical protein